MYTDLPGIYYLLDIQDIYRGSYIKGSQSDIWYTLWGIQCEYLTSLDMKTVKLKMQRSKSYVKLDIDDDLDVQGVSFSVGRLPRPETAYRHRAPVLSFRSRTIINDLAPRYR